MEIRQSKTGSCFELVGSHQPARAYTYIPQAGLSSCGFRTIIFIHHKLHVIAHVYPGHVEGGEEYTLFAHVSKST